MPRKDLWVIQPTGYRTPMIVILPDRSMHALRERSCTIEGILQQFGINPVEVIVTVNGTVVPEDAVAAEGDTIHVLQIAHGG